MASIEKLMKAFEALKVVQTNFEKPDEAIVSMKFLKKETTLNKKGKTAYCNTITEIICSPNLRNIEDFHKFLGIAIETLLACCDDADSDVRMVVNECLNKMIKSLMEFHLGRIQVELYKEIKKNGASRSVRAALTRFADLCPMTRPAKCRPFAQNVFPCLIKLSQRVDDEALQETLRIAITKIMPVLGPFANDSEIINLLTNFLANLESSIACVRRTAATCLVVICQFSRKPYLFYSWLLSTLLQYYNTTKESAIESDSLDRILIGTFLCFKHMIPQLFELPSLIEYESLKSFGLNQKEKEAIAKEYDAITENLLQLYELLLYHLRFNSNHNVILVSLETLNYFFKYPSKLVLPYLIDPKGIDRSRIGVFTKTEDSADLSRKRTNDESIQSSCENEAMFDDDDNENFIKNVTLLNASSMEDVRSQSSIGTFQNLDFDIMDSSIASSCGSLPSNLDTQSVASLSVNTEEFENDLSNTNNSNNNAQAMKLTYIENEDISLTINENISNLENLDIQSDKCSGIEIGEFTTENVSSLEYCVRLLSSNFLLAGKQGKLISDKSVRVSIKSLALGCIAEAVKLYPKTFVIDVCLEVQDSNTKSVNSHQKIWDIILYSNHSDPHLRGQIALVIGSFLNSILSLFINFNEFLLKNCSISGYSEAPTLEDLLDVLSQIIFDKQNSSVTIKYGLEALKICLNAILETNDLINLMAINLVDQIIELKNNSYWLVKVELLEILSSLPFKTIHHLESQDLSKGIKVEKENIQEKIINKVFIPLICDEDFRVRQAVSDAIIRMIPLMFTPLVQYNSDPISTKAFEDTMINMPSLFQVANDDYFFVNENSNSHNYLIHLIQELDDPLSKKSSEFKYQKYLIEANLKKMILFISDQLKKNIESKSNLIGYCQTLSLLAEKYPVIEYLDSWGCNENNSFIEFLINILLSLLSTSTVIALDINTHQQLINLIINLLEGQYYFYFTNLNTNENQVNNELQWGFISKNYPDFVVKLEFTFNYLMKILMICSHIIDESNSSVNLPSNSISSTGGPSKPNVMSSFSNSAFSSPIKKKSLKSSFEVSEKFEEKFLKKSESEKEKHGKINLTFNPLFGKLYELLRSSYLSHKASMEFKNNKIMIMLKAVINGLSKLLEFATFKFIGKYLDELLNCLKIVISVEHIASCKLVRQMLKCIFGTNFAMLFSDENHLDFSQLISKGLEKETLTNQNCNVYDSRFNGLYQCCIAAPYAYFTQFYALRSSTISSTSHSSDFDIITNTSFLRKRIEKRVSLVLDKNPTSTNQSSLTNTKTLTSHIRLFEPVVIKALKQYTSSTDVNLQNQVLNLLSQLVQLRVNYCLLDSDQIFINYILKQFDFIENIQHVEFDQFISHVFFFLILLSYERYHSKPIIGIPKIIQLCDGIMASSQQPERFAASALKLLVEDLILHRSFSKIDSYKELEAQKEVVIANLLKLVHYPEIFKLLLLVVQQSRKEGEEKWKKISRQVTDAVLPLLMKQLMHIDNYDSLEILHALFESVSPSVFRPVNILLTALFAAPQPDLFENYYYFHRWISLIIVVLRVIIVQTKEEVVLTRLNEMKSSIITVGPFGLPVIQLKNFETQNITPFHILTIPDSTESSDLNCDEMLAQYLLQIVQLCANEILNRSSSIYKDVKNHNDFVIQQLANYMLILTHMFQSGTFRKVAKAAMLIIKSSKMKSFQDDSTKNDCFNGFSLNQTISDFLSLIPICPTLVLQWFNLLMLLNFEDNGQDGLWDKLISPKNDSTNLKSYVNRKGHSTKNKSACLLSSNSEMIKRGTLILLCDFICENLTDAEHMTWLIVQYINDIVKWSYELPIAEFIRTIHRNSASSELFIQAVNARCDDNLIMPSFVQRLLRCLENVHASQSTSLISFLIEKLICNQLFKGNHFLKNQAAELAYERLNQITSSFDCFQSEISNRVSMNDINKLIEKVDDLNYKMLHNKLIELKNCLNDSTSSVQSHPLTDSFMSEKLPELNKEWFLMILKKYCQMSFNGHKAAYILNKFNYDDVASIMHSKEFQLNLISDCIEFGEKKNLEENSKIDANVIISKVINRNILLKASLNVVIFHMNYLINLLPALHYPFLPHSEMNTPKEAKHRDKIIDLFNDLSFWNYLFSISSGFLSFLNHYQTQQTISSDLLKNFVRMAILYAEAVQFMVEKTKFISLLNLTSALRIMESTIKCKSIFTYLSSNQNITYQCSFIAAIHSAVEYFYNFSPKNQNLNNIFSFDQENSELKNAHKSCLRMAHLVSLIEHNINTRNKFNSPTIDSLVSSIVLTTAQLPLVNSFVMVPPLVWNSNCWKPKFTGEFGTIVPTVPSDYLQDKDILIEFSFRIRKLGWSNRIQFEEIWMSLLGVLGSTSIHISDVNSEEHSEYVIINCIAIKVITELLLLSTLIPYPGNPIKSCYPKNTNGTFITFLQTRSGEKFNAVRNSLQEAIDHIKNQVDQLEDNQNYCYGQVPISRLIQSIKPNSPSESEVSPSVSSCSSSSSGPSSPVILGLSPLQTPIAKLEIDLTSCLHFLQDLYGQMLSTQPIHFPMATEIAKSIVLLSDLFLERAQFEWMLDTFYEWHNTAQAYENEMICQYLIVGICKSSAVLGLENELMIERCKKCLETSLKSSFLPNRIASLHGLSYLLEHKKSGKESVFVPVASDYILKHLGDDSLPSSHNFEHVNQMWKLSFHIIKHFVDDFSENEFGQKIFQLSLKTLTSTNPSIFFTILNGIEHLLLSEKFTIKNANDILKIAFENFKNANSQLISLSLLKLITSTTYFIGSIGLDINSTENEELMAMEKLNVIFDRLKTCYPYEAEHICKILPNFLFDFFPTQDILNKCIGEFLSCKQSHAQHLASVLFQLFKNLLDQSQQQTVHDWVILSQSSFSQVVPLSNAIWSLTIFLISASANQWIRSTFPYVKTRLGVLEDCDREMFCHAVLNFYQELKTNENRQAFKCSLQNVAEFGSPYAEALRFLSAASYKST